MGLCHPAARNARPGVVTTYHLVDRQWVPDVPSSCPLAAPRTSCRLGRHSRRERKTGPCHPLTVMRCRTHGVCFSLHPVGYVPYARQPITPEAGATGSLVGVVSEAAAGELWPWRPVAAADGSESQRGQSIDATNERATGERGWRSTQAAHVRRAATMTGIAGELDGRCRPRMARVLGVDTLLLRELAGERRRKGWLGVAARAAHSVVDAMARIGTSLFERLAAAGHVAGLWGPVSRCDGPGRPLRPLFPRPGRARGHEAVGPPTRQRHR